VLLAPSTSLMSSHVSLGPPSCTLAASPVRAHHVQMMAKAKSKKKTKPAKKPVASKGGFGKVAVKSDPEIDSLIKQGKVVARSVTAGNTDPKPWLQWAAASANVEEYAEARMIMETGLQHCGAEEGAILEKSLGQMRREGPSDEVAAQGSSIEWPGKGDESPYLSDSMSFERFSAPAWPSDCPRGTYYPTGEGAVVTSTTPVISPDECAWVVQQAEKAAREQWVGDHADASNIGTDKIWAKPFPDRLWLREVPALVEWFEHRLHTRLFPMLHSLYPEAIPSAAALRCHDAFISRYDAGGMNSLDVHQDTTDFTFTIAMNSASDYEGGGTLFPSLRPAGSADNTPFSNTVVRPDVGCVASFSGRLHHGGNAITSGTRFIIPLFIYIDVNKLSGRPRGYLLEEVGIPRAELAGLDRLN